METVGAEAMLAPALPVTRRLSAVNLLESLGVEIGERGAGTADAAAAAEAVAEALREVGLQPRFQEFRLLGYEAEEPELEIEGVRWDAGPCMYANPTDGSVEGRVRRLGTYSIGGFFPEADVFVVEDDDRRELARLHMSPFGGAAIPFLAAPRQIITGPTAFISGADAERLRAMEGAHARVRIGGRFVPNRVDRNVIAELPGESDDAVLVSAHFDSVWRGPGVVDNATGCEGMWRVAERAIPAASVSHFPYDEYHLPSERLELIDEQKLADSVELATRLTESLLEEPVPPDPSIKR